MKKYLQSIKQKKGFTLIEMIVVIAIISIVTVLVLANNAKLNSSILVSNTAYEIGLIVRESQVAGLGVSATVDDTFSSSHGVHLDIANPKTIILFADKNNNGIYDAVDNELTQEYNITNSRAGSIIGFCKENLLSTTTTSYCNISSGEQTADIVFARPNPEALFKIQHQIGDNSEEYVGALVISVGFQDDVCRSVVIEKTGSVEITKDYCSPAIN